MVDFDTWMLSGLLRGQQDSASGTASMSARLVLLDGAVLRASVPPGKIGLEMDWQVAGDADVSPLTFADASGRPWSVVHLRRTGDQVSWMRRGDDVAESWTFPEANNAGHCAVEVDTGSGFDGRVDVDMPFAAFTPGVLSVRVA